MTDAKPYWQRARQKPECPTPLPKPDPSATVIATVPQSAATSKASSDHEAEALISELREAVRAAGIQRNDPMMPLLSGFVHSIRFLAERTARSDHITQQSSQQIRDAVMKGREFADSETARFKAGLANTEAETIQRISVAIARSADDALTKRIQVFDRNSVLAAAGVLFAVSAGFFGFGYEWGHHAASTGIHETEVGLQAAFAHGPQAAQDWLNLMQWNDLPNALAQCSGAHVSVEGGTRGCMVPLWIESPQRSIPHTGD